MRPVVIVFLDPTGDATPRFLQVPIFRGPDFFFFQAAMEALDVTVALWVVIRRTAVRDAQPCQRLHEPRGSKLGSIIGGQSKFRLPTSRRQPLQHRLFYGIQRLFGPATMGKIPSYDFPCAAIDDADEIRPPHRWSSPNLGHVGLPDLIRLCCFHATPLFFPPCSQASRANQQASLAHHPQHSFAIHEKSFLPPQPPGHAAIAVRGLFSAGYDDLLVPRPICATSTRLVPVVQARSTDHQRRGYYRRRVSLLHQRARLGVNFTAAHSPTTFFRISISRDLRPSVRSSCRMRRSFSLSAAAALFPPSAAFAPCSASSFQR